MIIAEVIIVDNTQCISEFCVGEPECSLHVILDYPVPQGMSVTSPIGGLNTETVFLSIPALSMRYETCHVQVKGYGPHKSCSRPMPADSHCEPTDVAADVALGMIRRRAGVFQERLHRQGTRRRSRAPQPSSLRPASTSSVPQI
jgi:hypothetical protein